MSLGAAVLETAVRGVERGSTRTGYVLRAAVRPASQRRRQRTAQALAAPVSSIEFSVQLGPGVSLCVCSCSKWVVVLRLLSTMLFRSIGSTVL